MLPSDLMPIVGLMYVGCRSESVKRVQLKLNELKIGTYPRALVVDGAFGMNTDAAVRAFQKAHRLAADGLVGPLTCKALGFPTYIEQVRPYTPPPMPRMPFGPLLPIGPNVPPAPPETGIERIVQAVADAIESVIGQVVHTLSPLSEALGDILQGLFTNLIGIARSVRTRIMSLAMFTQAQAMLAALRGEIISLKQRVRTTLVGIATGVFSIVSGFFARIADAVGTAFETVHKMADAVANGVRKLVDIALAAVGAMVSTVRSTVSEIIDALP